MRRDLVSAIYGVAFLALIAFLWWEGERQDFTLLAPGVSYDPLFFPRLLLVLGALCAAAIAATGLLRPRVAQPPVRWGLWLGLSALIAGYFWAMARLGFPSATVLFMVAFAALLGYRRWPVLVGFATVTTAVVWYVFTTWLQVPLPVALWLSGIL